MRAARHRNVDDISLFKPAYTAVVCSAGALQMTATRRALVVDDDGGVRLLLRRILARHDFDVDMARDGAEAIEKMLVNDYAVIVLDLMMPRIDGKSVVRYLQNHMPDKLQSIIAMSAFGASAMAEVCPPVARFVEKPFDLDELIREVTACYAARRASGPDASATTSPEH